MIQQSERTGIWTNITDADIEAANDQVEQPGEMGGDMAAMMGGEGGNPQGGPEQSNGGPSAGQETPRVPQAKNPGVKTPVPKIPIPRGANDSDLFKLRTTDMNFNHLKSNGQFAEAPDGAGGGSSKNGKNDLQNAKKDAKVKKTLRYNFTVANDIYMKNRGCLIPAKSKIDKVMSIASGNKIREINRLNKVYKTGNSMEWQKVRCNADVKFPDGTITRREVHYYWNPSTGEVEYKFPMNKKQIGK